MSSKYQDKRADFWREQFEAGLSYEEYLEKAGPHEAKWKEMAAALPAIDPLDSQRLSGHRRILNVLVMASAWCGDCARQMPILHQIAETIGPDCEMMLVDRESSEELREELRILGANRIPVVVFLSEDFYEIGRFGDRLLMGYRSKVDRELGEACDAGILPPSADELDTERDEWLDIFERMLLMLRLAPPLRERYGD
ncbi:MAG: thioredoxin family protein [Candidatus Krumholzibacteria bacterium]|jgi:glutaredoxin|nr:thioredoxin family protein [Candidatus Krumholzibacteria bacterium]MDP6668367.1 thioredoxin family protein [Candidatus Krumholzibacteria bacterium]MDP6797416.1 thioredoxin family protein [Candidatus Krumholzibacteria bacterium]MDP7022179.1 thioredoxin family protein [Candidatus Krumholzibacteria bacterium]